MTESSSGSGSGKPPTKMLLHRRAAMQVFEKYQDGTPFTEEDLMILTGVSDKKGVAGVIWWLRDYCLKHGRVVPRKTWDDEQIDRKVYRITNDAKYIEPHLVTGLNRIATSARKRGDEARVMKNTATNERQEIISQAGIEVADWVVNRHETANAEVEAAEIRRVLKTV